MVVCINTVLLFATKILVAQVSTPNNFGGFGDYVCWQLGQNLDLNIVNENRLPINFFTDSGAGSLSNLRMFIQGNDGNVGIGNFTTAN